MGLVQVLAYLDPGDGGASIWQLVLVAAFAVGIFLAVLYFLVRFVAWALKR